MAQGKVSGDHLTNEIEGAGLASLLLMGMGATGSEWPGFRAQRRL